MAKLNLEHKVAKAIFISNKTYCLYNNDQDIVKRLRQLNQVLLLTQTM